MTDSHFIPILELLHEIHEENPNMRFGLVLQTAIDRKKKKTNFDFHSLTSKELRTALEEFQVFIQDINKKNKEIEKQEKIRKERLREKLRGN